MGFTTFDSIVVSRRCGIKVLGWNGAGVFLPACTCPDSPGKTVNDIFWSTIALRRTSEADAVDEKREERERRRYEEESQECKQRTMKINMVCLSSCLVLLVDYRLIARGMVSCSPRLELLFLTNALYACAVETPYCLAQSLL